MTRLTARRGRQFVSLAAAAVLIAAAAVYRIEAGSNCATDTFGVLLLGGFWLAPPCAALLSVGKANPEDQSVE